MVSGMETLERVCVRLREFFHVHVRAEEFRCFVEEFRDYVETKDNENDEENVVKWPLHHDNFHREILGFLTSGSGTFFQKHIGFDLEDPQLRELFLRIDVVTLTYNQASAQTLQHEYAFWQDFVDGVNEAHGGPTRLIQASQHWPRMKLELALINGSLIACAITVAVAALALLIFTRGSIHIAVAGNKNLTITITIPITITVPLRDMMSKDVYIDDIRPSSPQPHHYYHHHPHHHRHHYYHRHRHHYYHHYYHHHHHPHHINR